MAVLIVEQGNVQWKNESILTVAGDIKQINGFAFNDLHNTFIRNVSHELRTPLAVLMGYAELLNTGELGTLAPEQQEAMFIIMDRAQELQTMVARISTMLAIQANEFLKQPLELSALISQMMEMQRAKAEEAHITLELNISPIARRSSAIHNYCSRPSTA